MPERRIGLFGGSFDPIHLGHLIMAQDACEALNLDRVLFIPAAQSPLKDTRPAAGDAIRHNLAKAAISGNPRFAVSDWELKRGSISYSIETARHFQAESPDAQLYWIMGADQAAQLEKWRSIEELAEIVEFILLERNGVAPESLSLPAYARYHSVETHAIRISSSEIRQRLRDGKPVKYFLPGPVFDAIKTDSIYSQTT